MTGKYTELMGQTASGVTLSSCVFVVAGKALDFLNQYGIAFGVIFACCTFLMNWYYKHLHYELAKAKAVIIVTDD